METSGITLIFVRVGIVIVNLVALFLVGSIQFFILLDVKLPLAVVIVSLIDTVLQAEVSAVGDSSHLSLELLSLNAVDPRAVRLACLDPAALISNDVLVRELRNCFNLLHGWMREQCSLTCFWSFRRIELQVHLDFLKSVDLLVQLVLHLKD